MGNACSKKASIDKDRAHAASNVLSQIDTSVSANRSTRFTAYNSAAIHLEELILLHQKLANAEQPLGPNLRKPIRGTSLLDSKENLSSMSASNPKSKELGEFLLGALDHHFAFHFFDTETKWRFVEAMREERANMGEWVMHQGDIGDYFCVIAEGSVGFYIEPDLRPGSIAFTSGCQLPTEPPVFTGGIGTVFGDLSLLYNQARAASVLATTPLKFYKLYQPIFQTLEISHMEAVRSDHMSVLKKSMIFQDLNDDQLYKLVDMLTVVNFDEGERIVNKGDCVGSLLYIVKSGEVELHDIGHGHSKFNNLILKEGECFGIKSFFESETQGRAANVTSVTKSSLVAISKSLFEQNIGPIEKLITRIGNANFLSSITLMRNVPVNEIYSCVELLREEHFKKNDKISAKGKLYMIQDGQALLIRPNSNGKEGEDMLVRLTRGDYFGDLWVDDAIDSDVDQLNQHNINAETDLTCLVLLASNFERVVGDAGDIARLLINGKKTENGDHAKRSVATKLRVMTIKSQKYMHRNDRMRLKDIEKVCVLGEGAFGKVWLVTPKQASQDGSKPKAYALKMISKHQMLQYNLVTAVMREKNVLESIQHPFLLNLVTTFQDEDYLYMLLNLVSGGDLFDLMNGQKKIAVTSNKEWKHSNFWKTFGPEEDASLINGAGVGLRQAVFYSACVISALAHLYERRIAYRDIKPENIMIDPKGYCVVVDMGMAKVVLDKTYTMCGTPEYISPEIILHIGHNYAADHWSFGCLLYELIVGKTPFYNTNSMDQLSLMKRIVQVRYHHPEFCSGLSPQSQGIEGFLFNWSDLTHQLLKNNPAQRLGNLSGGIQDVIGHDWFESIDFDELITQKVPAPWLPNVKDPLELSNHNIIFADLKDGHFSTKLCDDDQERFSGF